MEKVGIKAMINENGDAVVTFSNDTVLEADLPVEVPDGIKHLYIIGSNMENMVTITLKCQKQTQPCIGHATMDDMSYGRWSPSRYDLEKITVNNANVICVGYAEQPFTLGSYGRNVVPEVVLLNKAQLHCPELMGNRIVVKQAVAPEGSTKISDRMEYMIVRPGVDTRTLLDDERKDLVREISAYVPAIADRVDIRHSKTTLEHLLACVKFNKDIDVSYWLDKSGNSTYWMTLRTCAILHMPLEFAHNVEFIFECNKFDWLRTAYTTIPEDMEIGDNGLIIATVINNLIAKSGLGYDAISDDVWEFYYEMIPTYFHDFKPRERTHKEEVLVFLSNYSTTNAWLNYMK